MNIEELYRTYFDIVYRYIRTVSRDGSLAEEVTQETFFKALKKADQFRGDCDVRVWLCQIAKNTLYDHLKKQKKQLPGEEQPEKMCIRDSHCTVGRYHSFHPYYVLRRNDCTFLRERSLWTGPLFSSPLFLLPAGICFCYVPAHGGCNGRKTDQQSSDLDVCMQFLCNGAFHPRTSCHCICK